MNDSNLISQLLRTHIKDMFEIITCEISIVVNDDLKSAVYTYAYKIKAISEHIDENWREVFAYKVNDFRTKGAYPGWPDINNQNTNNGLGWEVNPLSPEKDDAVLTFPISATKTDDGLYVFHYICETKIESLKDIRWFGGVGSIWYWTAQECKCNKLTLKVLVPKKVNVIDTHPNSTRDNNGYYVIEENDLLPMQFVSCLVSYEKRRFGIPPKYAPLIDRVSMLVAGGLISWAITLL